MTEPSEATAKATPAAKPKPAKPPKPPLPSFDDIADWVGGADVATIGNLFSILTLKTFDAKVMQVRKAELLPQHWQVISELTAPPDEEFDALGEIGRLRVAYKDQELARRRIEPLRECWRELRGKRPALWSVLDLFAGMRRLMARGADVDWNDLLTATRDIWLGHKLPFGKEQLTHFWNCLDFIRQKTKG